MIETLFKTGMETEGRIYRDDNNNNTRDGSEPIIDEDNPSPEVTPQDKGTLGPVHTSPLLTVWRKLFVEVDSMGVSNQTHGPDDPAPGDIPDPDTSALAGAFQPAFIDVQIITDARSEGALPFDARFTGETGSGSMTEFAATHRQTQNEDDAYWTVYVVGVYELSSAVNFFNRDNDLDGEFATLGWTTGPEAEVSLIPEEIIRDVAVENSWSAAEKAAFRKAVVVHEIGHQFELQHFGDITDPLNRSVMTIHINDAQEVFLPQLPTTFRAEDIDDIREFGTGTKKRP